MAASHVCARSANAAGGAAAQSLASSYSLNAQTMAIINMACHYLQKSSKTMSITNCTNCRTPISDKAIFCPKCGHSLNSASLSVYAASVENRSADKFGLKAMLNISGILAITSSVLWAVALFLIFLKVNSDLFPTIYWIIMSIIAYRTPLLGFSLLLLAKKSAIRKVLICCLMLLLLWCVYISLGNIIHPLAYYNLIEYSDPLYLFLSSQDIPQAVNLLVDSLFIFFIGGCIYLYRKTSIIIPLILYLALIIIGVPFDLNITTFDTTMSTIFAIIKLVYGLWFALVSNKTWLELVKSQQ